ncbi:hypothetical protein CEUSTIGMA_g13416.t1 [Chlamydomonas eustigma]|uniref:Uncharacterized protein n=1 Tax=Chlamydomonas eustigma TaxID=1157962 RepID=A0A250XT79_9CHLO|nr:hypothetical protein CEUSTIGMA_g13416.t1 [Chlamydomonas eustigma]|eukprot:GAX86000.1 hypothetical protein CEUSTIGMA_g13416.t1 [Chlamydomonas eustigma]
MRKAAFVGDGIVPAEEETEEAIILEQWDRAQKPMSHRSDELVKHAVRWKEESNVHNTAAVPRAPGPTLMQRNRRRNSVQMDDRSSPAGAGALWRWTQSMEKKLTPLQLQQADNNLNSSVAEDNVPTAFPAETSPNGRQSSMRRPGTHSNLGQPGDKMLCMVTPRREQMEVPEVQQNVQTQLLTSFYRCGYVCDLPVSLLMKGSC